MPRSRLGGTQRPVALDPLDARDRGGGARGEPEPAVAAEALLRREVVDVGLRGVEAEAAGAGRRVDEHELVRGRCRRAGGRRASRRSTSRCAGSSTRRRRASARGAGGCSGALSITSGSSRCGAFLVTAANLDENSPNTRCWLRSLDETERGGVPERGGAAVAEQHLVAVGQLEEVARSRPAPGRRRTRTAGRRCDVPR